MPNTANAAHESAAIEILLRESLVQSAEEMAASLNGGVLTDEMARRAQAAVDLAIQTLSQGPDDAPAPMTQHEAMKASVEAFEGERRDQAVSHANHCVDSVLEELRAVAMGDVLTPERAFLLVVALESAGDHLEDVLEGLYG